jgi:hypothetical protein
VSVHLTKFRVVFTVRIIFILVILCFRRLFLFQIMAQVKVRDSIASLGYMSDSEDEVVPTLPTPPIPPTKMLVFFVLLHFVVVFKTAWYLLLALRATDEHLFFFYIISERVPITHIQYASNKATLIFLIYCVLGENT